MTITEWRIRLATWEQRARLHQDVLILATLFGVLRLSLLLVYRPHGYFNDEFTDYGFYMGVAQLSARGVFPFLDFWMEYPPVFPWLTVLAYHLSYLLPPLLGQPLFNFRLVLGGLLLPFDVGNLLLVYSIAYRVRGANDARRYAWVYALLFVPLYTWLAWFDIFPLFFLLLSLYFVLSERGFWAGLVSGAGFMVKVFPILGLVVAVRFLSSWRRKTVAVASAGLAIMLIALPFLLQSPRFLLASFQSMITRPSWETIWALLDGYYSFGLVAPLGQRFDLAAASQGQHASSLPWLWITVAFALLYLFLATRRMARDGRSVVAFTGLTCVLFVLYSKGYSPQFLTYLLPFILLALPLSRGVAYTLLLSLLNLGEYPIYFYLLPGQPWFLSTLIILRTVLLVAICIELGLILYPWLARLRQVWKHAATVLLVTTTILGCGALGAAIQAWYTMTYAGDAYRPAMEQIRTRPGAAVVFIEPALFERSFPFLSRERTLCLLADAPGEPQGGARNQQRLAELAQGCTEIWVVHGGSEPGRDSAVQQYLSEHWSPVTAQWFDNCRLNLYAQAPGGSSQPLDFRFGDVIVLRAMQLSGVAAQPDEIVTVGLSWEVSQAVSTDYTVFVHLADAGGRLWAQHDGQPVGGFRPTTGWTIGEAVQDRHGFIIPADAPAGAYTIYVGLYDAVTNVRLPAVDAAGQSLGDRVPVARFAVSR